MPEKKEGFFAGLTSLLGKAAGCFLVLILALAFMGECGDRVGKSLQEKVKQREQKEETDKRRERERRSKTPGLTRQNPASEDSTLRFKAGNWLQPSHSVDIRILKTVRGANAHELAKRLNQFNSIPDGGTELVIIKLEVTVARSEKKETSFNFYPGMFDLFSSSGSKYESRHLTGLEPSLRGELFEGGSSVGWLTFVVSQDDYSPLLSFGRNSIDGTGGVWWEI